MSKPLVFISYSHKDKKVLDLLRTQLQVLGGVLDPWDDTRIEAGGDWFPQIKTAIDSAQLAIPSARRR